MPKLVVVKEYSKHKYADSISGTYIEKSIAERTYISVIGVLIIYTIKD